MNPDVVIEFGQEAALNSLMLVAPMLIAGIVVAVIVGLIQSMTQIQDQTISAAPKIICIALTFALCLPWLSGRMVDYAKDMFGKPHFIQSHAPSMPQSPETRFDNQRTASTPDQIASTNQP